MVYNYDSVEQMFNDNISVKIDPGDSCIINGIEFKHIGAFNSESDIPKNAPTNCIWYKRGEGLYFRCPDFSEIGSMMRKIKVQRIAEDNTPITRTKLVRNVFKIPLSSQDNRLKLILKRLINDMDIELKDYRDKFGTTEEGVNRMNNMRRLLVSDANLTIEKFEEWLDILGARWSITVHGPNGQVLTQ